MTRYYLLLLWMGFLFHANAQEQSLVSSSGGYFQTNGFNVSWSLGETIGETFSTGTYTVTQGFQQSMLEPVGIIDNKNPLTSVIDVFPNPTQALVYIKLRKGQPIKTDVPDHFTLYDIKGKQLLQGRFSEDQLIIDLASYSGAVYYLRLYKWDSNVQSTVIIQKIN